MWFKRIFIKLPLSSYLFEHKSILGKALLLLVMLLVIMGGSTGLGCIEGLQPIGWSGGVVADGILFVGSKEGKLVAINIATGTDYGRRQWSESLKMPASGGGLFGCMGPAYGGGCGGAPAGVAIYGTPTMSGDLVYIGGYNGKMYAFNSSSLVMRWVYPRESYLKPIVSGPVIVSDSVYFSTSDGVVYALDAATGDKQWEFQAGDKIWSTPASDGITVYISSFDNKLYALNAENGAKKWEFEAQGSLVSTPLVYNNKVYVGSLNRYLYAVNASDGSQEWKFMGESWFWAKPVAHNNVIYAPSLDGKVYILDAESGGEVADAVDLKSPVSSSPVLVDDKVIIASQKGVVYALDTVTNKSRALADIEEEIYSPLCASDGVIFIHTQDYTVHPVDANTGGKLATISLKISE
ncbi:Outer membrane protein assembly factor BamB [subsurface metagenome]